MLQRVIGGVVVVLGASALVASPALAAGPGAADKKPLLANPVEAVAECLGATGGTPTDSFAVFQPNYDGTGDLGVTVALKKSDPNATYDISFYQAPADVVAGTPFCTTTRGTITTNRSGNGVGFFIVTPAPGKTSVFLQAADDENNAASYLETVDHVFGSES